ncbi:MAG: hypothetical protein GC162_12075 [Planctomycetes bacterium]|nr:hypothetical protein [Planctomycetota bacterium]
MNTFDFYRHIRLHNARMTASTLAYAGGALVAWLATYGVVFVLVLAAMKLKNKDIAMLRVHAVALGLTGLLALEALRRIFIASRLRAAARTYYMEGPDGSVSALRMQNYLAARHMSDADPLRAIVSQILLAAPALTAAAAKSWAGRITDDRFTLGQAAAAFDELGMLHAWVPLIDHLRHGPALSVLDRAELLWTSFSEGPPMIRIAADIAQNYFPITDEKPV